MGATGGGGRDDDDDDRPRRRRDRDDEDDDDARPRRRRPRDDDEYDDRPRRRPREDATNGLATAGLVLGILSLCTVGLTSIPGLICSVMGLNKPTGRGVAQAGLALNVLGVLLGAFGLFYGFKAVGESRARIKDTNNMKQIGLALHNDHQARGEFTSAYARDARGNPQTGLSWRVGLLPYIEHDNVYKQFDLSQPWDGATNRPLSNTRIATYTAPQEDGPSANTPYRVFLGGGAMFEEDPRVRVMIASVFDGTSNTILLVHASEQVPWAAPRELAFGANVPLPRLGHASAVAPGFNAVFVDGSVRFIKAGTPEATIRALITRAGGEPVGDF